MKHSTFRSLFNYLIKELSITDKVSNVEKCELIKFRIRAMKNAIEKGDKVPGIH